MFPVHQAEATDRITGTDLVIQPQQGFAIVLLKTADASHCLKFYYQIIVSTTAPIV